MMKRLMPLFLLAALCALPLAPLARSGGTAGGTPDNTATVRDVTPTEARALTAAERQQLQAAEASADPSLEELRGGSVVIALLLIIIIVIILT